jgi:hypothetical protein
MASFIFSSIFNICNAAQYFQLPSSVSSNGLIYIFKCLQYLQRTSIFSTVFISIFKWPYLYLKVSSIFARHLNIFDYLIHYNRRLSSESLSIMLNIFNCPQYLRLSSLVPSNILLNILNSLPPLSQYLQLSSYLQVISTASNILNIFDCHP